MPQIAEDRPPYVTFETQPVEDRAASLEAGHYVAKDVIYAIVTPVGSRDRIPRIAEEWFTNLANQVQQGRFKAEWLNSFREQLRAWKEGREIPVSGTPVSRWPAVSRSECEALLSAGLRTVEDLASANEEAVRRLGMGGRALKQRAASWLESASDVGKVAEELNALRQRNEELLADNKALAGRLLEIEQRLASDKPAVKARPL